MVRRLLAVAVLVGAWAGCSASADDPAPIDPGAPDAGGDGRPASDATPDSDDAGGEAGLPDANPTDAHDAEAPPSPECSAYCIGILQTCTPAGVAQYPSLAACHFACRLFPPGKEGDWVDYPDTFSCRRLHLAAAAPPNEHDHCHHAGPFGYGGCGGNCGAFCRIAMERCKDAASGSPFATLGSCMSECEGWPYAADPEYGISAYEATTPTSGHSIECREVMLMKTLESAAMRDAYCPEITTASTRCK